MLERTEISSAKITSAINKDPQTYVNSAFTGVKDVEVGGQISPQCLQNVGGFLLARVWMQSPIHITKRRHLIIAHCMPHKLVVSTAPQKFHANLRGKGIEELFIYAHFKLAYVKVRMPYGYFTVYKK